MSCLRPTSLRTIPLRLPPKLLNTECNARFADISTVIQMKMFEKMIVIRCFRQLVQSVLWLLLWGEEHDWTHMHNREMLTDILIRLLISANVRVVIQLM